MFCKDHDIGYKNIVGSMQATKTRPLSIVANKKVALSALGEKTQIIEIRSVLKSR
jgi:hypothetical protein